MLNPKPTFKSQQSTNKVQGMRNALPKLEISNEKRLSKNPTMLCINEKAKKPTLSRPLTLTLKKTEKYKLSVNKANHQSLPESPVCEELKLLKEQCKKNISRFARFAQKRRSCSYFIGLNDNEKDMESVAKSFESLPAMNERNMENFKETVDDADEGNGNFSDDSLEGDFKNPPRRCVSDYQINVHMNDYRSYLNYQNIQQKVLTGSQESILSDASVESFSKGSVEILDYDHDRHSSASFFLSRRRMQEGRSQESILTDESDYQVFPLRENADHRSTESVLTDDSDSLVKSAPLEMLFDSHYKRKRQNSATYSGNPNNVTEADADNIQNSANDNTPYRAVFRSKSLQDTRISKARSNTNFTEDNASLKTHVYCEFNFDNEHKDDADAAAVCGRSETIPRSSSLKPESMMILNDFVAHKPPKPKRNSSRTQSMRDRVRPVWKCIDTPLSSPALRSVADSDSYTASSISSACSEYQVTSADKEMKRDSIDSEVMQQFLQSANYALQSDGNKDSENEFYSPQTCADKNSTLQDELMHDRNDPFCLTKSHVTKIHDTRERSYDKGQVNSSGNDFPMKDLYETYDSLEPGGDACDLPREESSRDTSNLQSADARTNDDLSTSVDFRITRAIEGTVKLLSKEFENLVRQRQYLTREKRLTHGPEASENFAKLEAERDGRFYAVRRDIRLHSCGEDSDCADVSTMDRSLMESGSSTSASSCTNSPKRMWPPASRCPSHTSYKWTKTLPTIDQTIFAAKHPYAGIDNE